MKNTHKNIVIIALILIIIVLTIQLNSTKNEIINNNKSNEFINTRNRIKWTNKRFKYRAYRLYHLERCLALSF